MSRTKREMPTFFSFEIGPIRSLAEAMTDEEWGRWSKNALNDLSIGCVKKDTDPRVIAVFEKAKGNMDKEYQRKSKWYQNHVGNANDKQEKEQKHNETQTKPPEENSPKPEASRQVRNGTKPFGKFGNVYLTDDEYAELGLAVGNQNELNAIIDALGASLEDGSRTSTNHYATLTKWVQYRKDKDKEKEERQNANNETFAEREGRRQRKILERFGMV